MRSLHESFPCVRCFQGINGWGTHFLASMQTLEPATGQDLARRMPVKAQKDLLEWSPKQDLPGYLNQVLSKGTQITNLLDGSLDYRITDDRPFNEYFLLRQWQLYAH
jgi:hypothetical protein